MGDTIFEFETQAHGCRDRNTFSHKNPNYERTVIGYGFSGCDEAFENAIEKLEELGYDTSFIGCEEYTDHHQYGVTQDFLYIVTIDYNKPKEVQG